MRICKIVEETHNGRAFPCVRGVLARQNTRREHAMARSPLEKQAHDLVRCDD
jgi:hypothetical protein